MNYPEIQTGLGVLTPELFHRLMGMLRDYEATQSNYQHLNRRLHDLEERTPFFFAKLLRAHILDESLQNSNQYEYAWVRVTPKTGEPECCALCLETRGMGEVVLCCDENCDNTTALQGFFQWEEDLRFCSWGTNAPAAWTDPDEAGLDDPNDPLCRPCIAGANEPPNTEPYTHAAINLTEQFNTANHTFSTDETDGIGDFMLQAHGGGDTVQDEAVPSICESPNCTRYEFALNTTPIVVMWMVPESDGTLRYVFQAENGYDGTCSECS